MGYCTIPRRKHASDDIGRLPVRAPPLPPAFIKPKLIKILRFARSLRLMSLPHDCTGEQAPIQRAFFSNTKFAVVGASTNKEKYGTKILRWYLDRNKDVVPVHPKEAELEGVKTLATLAKLPDPKSTSVSVITPPPVTLNILKEAKNLDIPVLWLQPGAENDEVRAYIDEAGLKDRVVLGGPCVLVLGDRLLAEVAGSKANL